MTKKEQSEPWYVYIILTAKQTYYTGITTHIQRRFEEHLSVYKGTGKKGAKYFRSVEPLRIIHNEEFTTRSEASAREREIKSLSHSQKARLVEKKLT